TCESWAGYRNRIGAVTGESDILVTRSKRDLGCLRPRSPKRRQSDSHQKCCLHRRCLRGNGCFMTSLQGNYRATYEKPIFSITCDVFFAYPAASVRTAGTRIVNAPCYK